MSAYALTNDYATEGAHSVRRSALVSGGVQAAKAGSADDVHCRYGIGNGNLRECSVASRPLLPEPAHLALTRGARSRLLARADAVT